MYKNDNGLHAHLLQNFKNFKFIVYRKHFVQRFSYMSMSIELFQIIIAPWVVMATICEPLGL